MKITKITISNFLKLKDVNLDPEKVNVIFGKNGQGKTSILKAIQGALDGKLDSSMIRQGEDKAEITVELDDYIINRRLTEKGNYVDIENEEGFNVPAPQTFLNGLIGQFSFNPIEFFNLKASEKKNYLLQAIDVTLSEERAEEIVEGSENLEGIDFSKHGLEVVSDLHQRFYDQRRIVNREVDKKKKTIDELKSSIPEGFDPELVSVERIKELRDAITANEVAKEKKEASEKAVVRLEGEIKDIDEQIAKLKERRAQAVGELEETKELKFDIQDTSEMESELSELEAMREHLHTIEQVEKAEGELESETKEANQLNKIVKRLANDVPDELISEANLPVKGLEIKGDDVSLGGVNIENLSSSEQLQFALDVVRALNDKFNIICIDGIETLDRETFEWFLSQIDEDSYQYFITRVDTEGEGWLVEDGKVTNK